MTLLALLLIVFTLCSGFFSGSETALFSLPLTKVRAYRKSSKPKQRLVARLISHPRELLVTILMLNVGINILIQNVASSLFESHRGWLLKVGLPLILTLFFGEIIPKTIALANNERLSALVAPPITLIHRFLGPIRRLVTRLTSMISRYMFFFLRPEKEISTDELQHTLKASEKHNILTTEEADLIRGYLTFGQVVVKELMRPREELITFDLSQPLDQLARLFVEKECSRVPVCEGSLENLIGLIEASDYFLLRDLLKTPLDLKKHLEKPYFIPETMPAKTLKRKFDEQDAHLAVVVDEYGSITGLITHEDLVEVVVGEIADRRDQKTLYTRAGPDVVIASGRLELTEFNHIFNSSLESKGNIVTIGGWLTESLGKIPQAGTRYTTDDFLFHVLSAEAHRIRRLYIRRLAKGEESHA